MKKKKTRYLTFDGWCVIILCLGALYFPARTIVSIVWGI